MQANGNAISPSSENANIFLGLIQIYTQKEKITVQKAALQCTILPGTIALTSHNLVLRKLISPFFVELVFKRPWKEQLFIYSNNKKEKCITREEGKPIYIVLAFSFCYYKLKGQCCVQFHQIACVCIVQVREIKPIFLVYNLCSGPDIKEGYSNSSSVSSACLLHMHCTMVTLVHHFIYPRCITEVHRKRVTSSYKSSRSSWNRHIR